MSFGKFILVVFAASLVIGAGYFLPMLSPSPVSDESYMDVGSDKEYANMLLESEKLEKEFEEYVAKNGLNNEAIDKLRNAIKLQEQYLANPMTRDRAPAERLIKLKRRLQNIEAKPISEQVDLSEAKAKEAESKGNYKLAEKHYNNAYRLQTTIENDYEFSQYRDGVRFSRLANDAERMRVFPIYKKSLDAQKQAEKALKERKWSEAVNYFEQAFAFMKEIEEQYPRSIYNDFNRNRMLNSEIQSLQSTSLYNKLEQALKRVEEAKAKKNFPLVAEAYGDAAEIQRQINKSYPSSRHASDKDLDKFEKAKVDAFSWDFANAINVQDKKLSELIAKCDIDGIAEMSSNLLNKAEQFKSDYPRSKLVDSDLIMKLRHINHMVGDIAKIQSLVLKNTIDINGKKMLKTEVSQRLYKLVMRDNPSRDIDDDKPVDSVSYDDVERFCIRLSWLTSKKISIPTDEDFLAAVGSLRYADLNEISWNNANSGGRTQKIATKKRNDKGFYDLLGNVEEFVISKNNTSETITVMGGSAQSTTDSILDYARKNIDTKTRSRVLGFRIVISN